METDQNQILMGTAVILTNGCLDTANAKTAHGLIRSTERFKILGVIDANNAGKDAGEILDGRHRNIPVYTDIDSYMAENKKKPDYAVIGLALCGGRLDDEWQAIVMGMLHRGISIVNGMHMHLSEIPVFVETAQSNNARIIDIRKAKSFDHLHFWSGRIYDMKIPRIAILGTDCALGKRTTSQLIVEICCSAKIKTQMIYTGQTGWLQGNPYGFILDSTLNDFVSGELEDAIVCCEQESGPDLIIVEGQSALRNPLGPCGSEIILSGNTKGVILQHTPFRKFVDGGESLYCLLPDIETEIKLVEMYGALVIAVTLNGQGGTREEMSGYQKTLEKKIHIPVIIPLENSPVGLDRILPVIKKFIQDHGDLPDTTPRLHDLRKTIN
jgi:uncharacterized NAD-dependent epimerase/dehydratase family protein